MAGRVGNGLLAPASPPAPDRSGVLPVDAISLEIRQLEGNERDVSPRKEAINYFVCRWRPKVDRDASFAWIDYRGRPTLAGRDWREMTHGIAFGRLDLDNIGTKTCEQPAAVRNGSILCELDNLDAIEWTWLLVHCDGASNKTPLLIRSAISCAEYPIPASTSAEDSPRLSASHRGSSAVSLKRGAGLADRVRPVSG